MGGLANLNSVSNREFVTMRHHRACDDGSHLITIQSVNHKDKPFTPGFVRGSTRGARFFRPMSTPGDFELILVDHVVRVAQEVYQLDNTLLTTGRTRVE